MGIRKRTLNQREMRLTSARKIRPMKAAYFKESHTIRVARLDTARHMLDGMTRVFLADALIPPHGNFDCYFPYAAIGTGWLRLVYCRFGHYSLDRSKYSSLSISLDAHGNLLVGTGGFRQRAFSTALRWTSRLPLIIGLSSSAFRCPELFWEISAVH